MRLLLTTAIVSILLSAGPASATKLVQVVIDHSGILHDEQDPKGKSNLTNYLVAFLNELARKYRRDRDDTQIRLISAVDPPYALWVGSAADFYRFGTQSDRVKDLVTGQPNGCNNLIDALEEVDVSMRISNAGENLVYIITSGVHSGPGCERLTQDGYVKLVTTTDQDVVRRIATIAKQVNLISVHFLTATQRRAFFNELHSSSPQVKLFSQGEEPRL